MMPHANFDLRRVFEKFLEINQILRHEVFGTDISVLAEESKALEKRFVEEKRDMIKRGILRSLLLKNCKILILREYPEMFETNGLYIFQQKTKKSLL